MPQLRDPNFERGVVLMVEHNAQGSFGLVLNRPTDMQVSSVLESMSLRWRGDPSALVWSGGPVTPQSGWVLHEAVTIEAVPGIDVAPGLVLSTSPEQLEALAKSPPERLRFFMGYSGWGDGQLERELSEGAWIHADADVDLIFETPAAELWAAVLRRIGIEPGSLVPGAGVH